MLTGLTQPYTPSGRSSLVPPPPWHYAGQVLSIGFDVDVAAAASLLPSGFGPATGRAFVHVCDWQATTDGWELLDPVYSQYKELFVLIEAEGAAAVTGPVLYCPFIYVDQDVSMVRGLLQGWPKKMGSVWMTRSIDLDHPAAAPRRAGTRIGATLSVKDRRLAEATATLVGEQDGGRPIGFLATPTFGLVGAPSIIGDAPGPGVTRLVRQTVTAREFGPFQTAEADLRFFKSPRDELAMLAPIRMTEASVGMFALTVSGATEIGGASGA